MYLEESNLA